MSDTIWGAVIGGAIALAGILIEKIFSYWAGKQRGKKDFFKDFFPERLKAHQKIMRVIAQCGFDYLRPEPLVRAAVEKNLKNSRKVIEDVFFETLLIAEKYVSSALGDISRIITEATEIKAHLEEEDAFRDALERLQGKNRDLVKLLREKSGVDIIDDEFAEILNSLKRGKDAGDNAAKLKTKKAKRNIKNNPAIGHRSGSFPAQSGL